MHSLTFIIIIIFVSSVVLLTNLTFLNNSLLSALVAIEGVWISIYFFSAFVSFFICSISAAILLPLILVFAGLEVVLGLYFLFFI